MKIRQVRVRRENLELSRPYTIAYKTTSAVENMFVEVELENGIVGMGAGNPSQKVTGESIADTAAALTAGNLEWLVGRDIRLFRLLGEEAAAKFPSFPAAQAALDIALHDGFSQHLGVPLVGYLGQRHAALPTSITIGIKDVAATLEEAHEYVGRGFRHVKVKIGQSLEEDVERLVKLREQFGSQIMLRVDANQGYGPGEVVQFWQRTRTLDLELVEQPLPAGEVEAMRGLPEEIRRKLAADESLLHPGHALHLACPPVACGIFNIKLMKCGGITRAREIAAIAHHAGIDLMWGCNDESIVSITAALHAALSCPATRYLDLDGSLDLARDLVEGGFVLQEGMLSVNGQPGLGVRRIL
jgi:L-alanine-DL-glutamate epimerase-like enolase superfamily enzyme